MFIGQVFVRIVAALLAIAIPLALGWYLHKRYESPWRLFQTGCVTFVLSQVFHVPFNLLVLRALGLNKVDGFPEGGAMIGLAVFLGFSAGIFEETSRYVAYKYFLTSPENRTWKSALMFGSGHGGIESILLVGIVGLIQLVGMTIMRGKDLADMGIPEDQIAALEEQIEEYWSAPWYLVFLADVERVFAITCHLAMTVLVLQCFRRNNHVWLLAAVCWHAMIDFLCVLLLVWYGPYVTEVAVGLMAAGSVAIIWMFQREDDEELGTSGIHAFEQLSEYHDESLADQPTGGQSQAPGALGP